MSVYFRIIISIIGWVIVGFSLGEYIQGKDFTFILLLGIFFILYCIYHLLECNNIRN